MKLNHNFHFVKIFLIFRIILIYQISITLISAIIVPPFPNRPIAEFTRSTFTCAPPGQETFSRYIWKLDGFTFLGQNFRQFAYTPNRFSNGGKLSCTGVTERGNTSEECQIILKILCKYNILFI